MPNLSKFIVACLFLILLLQATTNALPTNLQNEKRDNTELHNNEALRGKYINLNAYKRNRHPVENHHHKRSGTDDDEQTYYDITVGNSRNELYLVDLEVGSNRQKVTVQIDTGSSDFWVFSTDSGREPHMPGLTSCKRYGVFDSKASDTFHLNQTVSLATYGDETIAQGYMSTDDVVLFPNNGGDGEFIIKNVSLGDVRVSNSINPVMGIGFKALQSVVDSIENQTLVQYDFLPYQMANQGLINIPAYSISILTKNKFANSSITFGAIDNTRFTGDLSVFPVPNLQGNNEPTYVAIVLNRITLGDTEFASGSCICRLRYRYFLILVP
ncbi:unnamed protein product [Ambrosiozyma monospora]|uniref:Unnamed protein product n=1 Tax=Ambrosiozyma monospora TaxID=43982 RepID=A0ACB5TPS3_AMBMO|nr:unnamed protein product [Ambrosiozyma monospora]